MPPKSNPKSAGTVARKRLVNRVKTPPKNRIRGKGLPNLCLQVTPQGITCGESIGNQAPGQSMGPSSLETVADETLEFGKELITFKRIPEMVYGGGIREQASGRRRFMVRFGSGKTRKSWSFVTKKEAEMFRREESLRRELTREERVPYFDTTFTRTEAHKQWCVGFSDGDGHLRVTTSAEPSSSGSVGVSIKQSRDSGEPSELTFLLLMYGGRIRKVKHEKTEENKNCRQRWRLEMYGRVTAGRFLEDVIAYGVVDRPVAEILTRFNDRGCADALWYKTAAEKERKNRSYIDIDCSRFTWAYLAGLFAADGTCCIDKAGIVRANITMKTCPRLLDAISATLGVGTADWNRFEVWGEEAVYFLRSIAPFSLGAKTEQIRIVLGWWDRRYGPGSGYEMTAEQREELAPLRKRLSVLKKL